VTPRPDQQRPSRRAILTRARGAPAQRPSRYDHRLRIERHVDPPTGSRTSIGSACHTSFPSSASSRNVSSPLLHGKGVRHWKETHYLRAELDQGLQGLGWEVNPGCANFLLCHLPANAPEAAELVEQLRGRKTNLAMLEMLRMTLAEMARE
jgi:hypothetical protein